MRHSPLPLAALVTLALSAPAFPQSFGEVLCAGEGLKTSRMTDPRTWTPLAVGARIDGSGWYETGSTGALLKLDPPHPEATWQAYLYLAPETRIVLVLTHIQGRYMDPHVRLRRGQVLLHQPVEEDPTRITIFAGRAAASLKGAGAYAVRKLHPVDDEPASDPYSQGDLWVTTRFGNVWAWSGQTPPKVRRPVPPLHQKYFPHGGDQDPSPRKLTPRELDAAFQVATGLGCSAAPDLTRAAPRRGWFGR